PASLPGADRQARVLARPGGSRLRAQDPGGYAGRQRRRHDRRQDAGRRHLETGQGSGRPRAAGGEEGQGLRGALSIMTGTLGRTSMNKMYIGLAAVAALATSAAHAQAPIKIGLIMPY